MLEHRQIVTGLSVTRSNSFKLREERSHVRKKLFTVRVVSHWNRFFEETVDTPFLKGFRARLGGILSNLAQWKVSLSIYPWI